MTQPRTVGEEHDVFAAGGGGAVRAAAFPVGADERGAVTLTLHVPDGFFAAREDGTPSYLLDPPHGIVYSSQRGRIRLS